MYLVMNVDDQHWHMILIYNNIVSTYPGNLFRKVTELKTKKKFPI